MKSYRLNLFILACFWLVSSVSYAETHIVTSKAEFDAALDDAAAGDVISWAVGTYSDAYMIVNKDDITIQAAVTGGVVFNGSSRLIINGDNVDFTGCQFLNGDIGSNNVVTINGSNVNFSHVNISGYASYKYLIIDELSQYVTVSYCNFENRNDGDTPIDQNILSILVDSDTPGYHKVQWCSFKDFSGGGNDDGVEPIRIGVSTQAEYISRSIVEYCYFTGCDGDGELISHKARQNVYRYNTFDGNALAELVLRHGDEGIVYGNFFLNGMGGVRVREAHNHLIFNNYFSGLTKRTIYLQNEDSDPLDNILIAYNTIINSAETPLGNGGSEPTNVTFANNIFADPISGDNLFDDATGNETWIGNIYTGALGISSQSGLSSSDPLLVLNDAGYYELSASSPAIDAAESGYPALPTYDGLDYDNDILLDLLANDRPADISMRDLGAVEGIGATVTPFATAENTGPSYMQTQQYSITISTEGDGTVTLDPAEGPYDAGTVVTITAEAGADLFFNGWTGDVEETSNPLEVTINQDLSITATFGEDPILSVDEEVFTEKQDIVVTAFPNPAGQEVNLLIESNEMVRVAVELKDIAGRSLLGFARQVEVNGERTIYNDISSLSPGVYFFRLNWIDATGVENKLVTKVLKN